jgi:hypothetical protein
MKIQLPLIVILLFNSGASSLAQSDLGLAPWFGNDMVLQRSTGTLLVGYGPPERTLTVTFHRGNSTFFGGSTASVQRHIRVDASGLWRLTNNLCEGDLARWDDAWKIRLEEENNRKNFREYQNIRMGDVIVVAGWENQGLPANLVSGLARSQFEDRKESIRFLRWSDNNFAIKKLSGEVAWQNWPGDESALTNYSTLDLRLAHMLAEKKLTKLATNRFIGIVLVDRNVLKNALDPARFGVTNGFEPLNDELWTYITEDVREQQTNRSKRLIQNKRLNVVSNIPPIIDYDRACCCHWADFEALTPPSDCFSFAAAIWSAPDSRSNAPHPWPIF